MSLARSGVRGRSRRRRPVLDREYRLPGAKGINVFSSAQFVGDQEGSSAMNMTLVETGCISKVTGWTEVGDGLEHPPTGLASYYPTGLDPMLLTIDGTRLSTLNNDIWQQMLDIEFSSSTRYDFIQVQGKLSILNGVDASARLSGTTLDRPATTVRAAFGVFYADRQIVSGVPSQPNRLYISSSEDSFDFTNDSNDASTHPGATVFAGTGAAYIDIARDDGDRIKGLTKYQTVLIIYKERSIYSLEYDSTGAPIVKMVTNAIGCMSHWSIDQVDNDIVFLSRNGYYVLGQEPNYFDQIRTNELSIRIRPYIQSILPESLDEVTSIWHNNVYLSSVPIGNTNVNNRVFTYHRQYTGWMQRDDINATAFTEFIDTGNKEELFYADATAPKVWKQTSNYHTDGQPIKAFWESKAYDFGNFGLLKRFTDVTLLFRQLTGNVKVTLIVDGKALPKPYIVPAAAFAGGMGRVALGRSLLGGKNEAMTIDNALIPTDVPFRIPIGADGFTIKIRLENNEVGKNFVFSGHDFGYRPFGRNKFRSELRVY